MNSIYEYSSILCGISTLGYYRQYRRTITLLVTLLGEFAIAVEQGDTLNIPRYLQNSELCLATLVKFTRFRQIGSWSVLIFLACLRFLHVHVALLIIMFLLLNVILYLADRLIHFRLRRCHILVSRSIEHLRQTQDSIPYYRLVDIAMMVSISKRHLVHNDN